VKSKLYLCAACSLMCAVLSAQRLETASPAGSPMPRSLCPDLQSSEDTMHYDGAPDRGAAVSGTYSYGGGVRFTAPESLRVVAVLYYLTGSADAIFVHVSDESTQGTPSERKLDTTRATGQGGGVWRRAEMPLQPAVPANRDFWTCVIVRRHPPGQYPLTLDLGPMVPWRGGFITLPTIGPDWYQLTDPPFWTDRNWNIRAVVQYAATGVEEVMVPTGSEEAPSATLIRGVLRTGDRIPETGYRAELLDAAGRRVMELRPGANDVRHLAPGVHFVRRGDRPLARVILLR